MILDKQMIKITKTGKEIFSFLIRCENCEKEEWLTGNRCKFGKRKFCSHKCINSNRIHTEEWKQKLSLKNSGVNNPFYGKKHKLESIAKGKCKDSWNRRKEQMTKQQYQIWYDNYCESVSGKNNAFFGKHHSEQTKKHLSEIKAKLIANGSIQITKSSRGLKGYYFSSKMNEMFRYDSFIELLRMKMLDIDCTVNQWTKRHSIIIPYEIDNKNKNYVPDFLIIKINNDVIIEEVKGYEEQNKKMAKFVALINYCESMGYRSNILHYSDIASKCQTYFHKSIYTLRKKYHEGKLFI